MTNARSGAADSVNIEDLLSGKSLSALIEKGKKNGHLSADELITAFQDVELSPALLDLLVERFNQEGVTIGDIDIPVPPEPIVSTSSPMGFTGPITDPVRAYLEAIGTIPLLTIEQERKLGEVLSSGHLASERLHLASESNQQLPEAEYVTLRAAVAAGLDARRRLVEANLRLVVSIAKRYRHRGVAFLDLIQEGNTGLVRAVEKFDVARGFKLSTYATWWIRQAMSRAVADQARTIRIPVHVYETLGRVLRVQRAMLQEHGTEPTMDELAARVQLPVERVKDILSLDRSTVSLEPQGEDPGLGDVLADLHAEMPADVVDQRALRESLQEALEGLNERERDLMTLRFGLDDGQPRSLEEVGRSFGVTRERVRQIETKTLAKLRTPLARHRIDDFLKED